MADDVKRGYSGIGGQAVLEGVMMKNGEKYAVAVRKPDGNIALEVEHYAGILHGSVIGKIPFVRGIFNFIDSMILGMRALNYSSSFYDDEAQKEATKDSKHIQSDGGTNGSSILVMIFSFILAIGLFIILPTFLASKFETFVRNKSLMAIIEGAIRIVIFLAYIILISCLKDIRRMYAYHGAEHKCINCIEKGHPLTVKYVMRASRFHKRCGTSFLYLVVLISVILFFFVRVETIWMRFGIRVLLIPVVAGISYEILRLAGKHDNIFVSIISAPGIWIQHITTKEPDKHMIQVAINSIEAVFDWKSYLNEVYNYDMSDDWYDDNEDDSFIKLKNKEEEDEFSILNVDTEGLTAVEDWEDAPESLEDHDEWDISEDDWEASEDDFDDDMEESDASMEDAEFDIQDEEIEIEEIEVEETEADEANTDEIDAEEVSKVQADSEDSDNKEPQNDN